VAALYGTISPLLSQIREEATHNTLAADLTLAVVISPSTSANPGYCILVEDRDGLDSEERGQREGRIRRELPLLIVQLEGQEEVM